MTHRRGAVRGVELFAETDYFGFGGNDGGLRRLGCALERRRRHKRGRQLR
jgi:hypothetical protein